MPSFLKKYKVILIVAIAVAAVLTAAFFMGGKLDEPAQKSAEPTAHATQPSAAGTAAVTTEPAETTASAASTAASSAVSETTANASAAHSTVITTTQQPTVAAKTSAPKKPAPASKPRPTEPYEEPTELKTVTLSINCSTVFDNMKKLKSGKEDIIPADGYFLSPTTVEITEGESVFELLLRVCTERGIHMDYKWTPLYNSAYIMGIGNLYEFDCGGNSGWMYRVDGSFPNYGCSKHTLKGGETVEFLYTCRLGYDIGGGAAQQVDE